MHFPLKRSGVLTLRLTALSLAALAPTMARAQTQDLFVANYNDSTISRFAGTGAGTLSTAPTTLSGGDLSHPGGITFDAHGNLFATNSQKNSSANTPGGTITEFVSMGTGTFATGKTIEAGLSHPQGLVFDAGGDLFAANTPEGTITEFASTGADTFAAGKTVATGLHNPFGLAFDAGSDLFVANQPSISGYGTITEFVSIGVGTFAAGQTIETGLSGPRDLAFDAGGDLFVANSFGNSITEFFSTSAGTFAGTTTLSDPSGTLSNPVGLAFDAGGDLFAANFYGNSVTEFASTGAGTFGLGQTVETGLNGPTGLAFGPSTSAAVPEASTTVSLGLLLALGLGGVMIAARRKKRRA